MTAPSSIDPTRFLHEQLDQASPDLLRQMLATFINTLMSAEADAICGAPYGQPARTGATCATATGTATLTPGRAPWTWRSRSCGRAPTSRTPLERRRRAERALTTVVATCYLLGVSTRPIERLVESLGITRCPARRSA